MNYNLRIEVADITTSLNLNDPSFFQQLKETFSEFLSDQPAEISIRVNLVDNLKARNSGFLGLYFYGKEAIVKGNNFLGKIDLLNKKGEIDILPSYARESLANFLRNIYNILITKEGGLVLHACGIVKDNKAYIFFGPSQSGKSTVAQLSRDYTILRHRNFKSKRRRRAKRAVILRNTSNLPSGLNLIWIFISPF